ncbi:hypothetical protein GQ595_08210 [Gilliamella sp. Pra-s54]|nr:hypothetical protein [Gilliamella sp. Pra-s54]
MCIINSIFVPLSTQLALCYRSPLMFDVEFHLPKEQEIIFTDVNQQLHDILNVYH